ncbi:MAG: DUF3667 domain-containing protein [Balneolales bacterium]|nr:DUF3667 domain-containing protein [Balneolales bacterium]
MKETKHVESGVCLNCGSSDVKKYCSNCGQKFQPTKQPLRIFLQDAVETLFNVDSRWLKTLTDLFFKPGKVTKEYIEGKRATYLPPIRIYISISIFYFIVIRLTGGNQIFLINFGDSEGNLSQIAEFIKYALFFLVPIFGAIVQLFYRKRKAYYVEYLIFALHIHSIWFMLLIVEHLAIWFEVNFANSMVEAIAFVITGFTQIGTFVYLLMYLKRTFSTKWLGALGKSMGILFLYMVSFLVLIIPFLTFFSSE